jgi:hypothetical protein
MSAACGLGETEKGRSAGSGREVVRGAVVVVEDGLITEAIRSGIWEALTGVSWRKDGRRITVVMGSSVSSSELESGDDMLWGIGMFDADIISRLNG